MALETNHRILIIDDLEEIHQDFRKILLSQENKSQKFIKKMNDALFGKDQAEEKVKLPPFTIDSAYQSQEGIDAVKRAVANNKPYALAFVDVQMPPGDDGVATMIQMWKLDPEIQIVICTAYAKYDWNDLAKIFGDTDRLFILKKPFDNLEVIQLASSLTKKWNMNHEVNAKLLELQKLNVKEQDLPHSHVELRKSLDSLKKATDELAAFNQKLKDKKLNPP